MQAKVYDMLTTDQLLIEDELSYLEHVYKWKGIKFRKRFSTAAAEEVYRKATALEALVCCGQHLIAVANTTLLKPLQYACFRYPCGVTREGNMVCCTDVMICCG